MTFRPKPVEGRTRSSFGDGPDRRNLFLNVGFAVVVVLAVLLLGAAAGLRWYSEHLAGAATVNGTTITRDQLRDRLLVEDFRLDLQARRLRDRLNAGTIREADYTSAQSLIEQTRQQIASIALERLIDGTLQAELATAEGVSITDTDVEAKYLELASTPELRHAWIIEVEPETTPGASEPTEAQIAAAKTKADEALADLRAGEAWEDVAKAVSTHATREQGGDLGYIADDASGDEAFVDALFAAEAETPTDVLVDADGVARIGRVTEVVPGAETPGFDDIVVNGGTTVAAVKEALRAEALRDALEQKVIADVTKSGPQRHVYQIHLAADDNEQVEGAVKTRHILYSPNDDPSGTQAGDYDDDTDAWAKAEADARAAHTKLKADISLFDATAREESDEAAAAQSGGKLPYFAPADIETGLDEAFGNAIFAAGLQPGQLLEPVKSAFGWHVIQIMHRPTDFAWAESLATKATSLEAFKDLARDNSDDAEAESGGDIGWVARGQLEQELAEVTIFEAPIGKVSKVLAVPDDGVYLFWVDAEEVREPDAEQLETLRETAFDTWYSRKKLLANITRDGVSSATTG